MKLALHLTLHAHIPGLWRSQGPARSWLARTTKDVYLPLLRILDDLGGLLGGSGPAFALALTPPLVAALEDDAHRDAIARELERSVEQRRASAQRLEGDPLHPTALFYLKRAQALHQDFTQRYRRDIMAALRHHARQGRISLIPSLASSAPLPMLATEALRRAELRATRRWAEQKLEVPWGPVWLPACAYSPELARELALEGVTSATLDAQSWRGASAAPVQGLLAPLRDQGVTFFARHPELCAPLRWAKEESSWQRDLGCAEALRDPDPWQHMEPGHEGLLCLRQGEELAPLYHPARAAEQARRMAVAWLSEARALAHSTAQRLELETPSISVAWGAQLWGGAWFEGPIFLKEVLQLAAQSADVELRAFGASLDLWPRLQKAAPGAGSWHPGVFAAWLDPSAAWLQRHARRLEVQLVSAVRARADLARGAGRLGAPGQDRAAAGAILRLLQLQGEDLAVLRRQDGLVGGLAEDVEHLLRGAALEVEALQRGARADGASQVHVDLLPEYLAADILVGL